MITYGIFKLVFGHPDPTEYNFFKDAGLLKHKNTWSTLNGSLIEITKSDRPGLISVEWAADSDHEFTDVNGIRHLFTSGSNLSEVKDFARKTNTFNNKARVNLQVEIQDTTVPCAIAHIAIFTPDMQKSCRLFEQAGFLVSDTVDGKCIFMRSKEENPHHQILLVQSADKVGLQHAALAVADIYTVFTKGINMADNGWSTLLGPGRHVISSSTHWYFQTDLGAFEFTCDEDYLTGEWQPTVYDPNTSIAYEWAIEGGIDSSTRRQKNVQSVTKSINDRMPSK